MALLGSAAFAYLRYMEIFAFFALCEDAFIAKAIIKALLHGFIRGRLKMREI